MGYENTATTHKMAVRVLEREDNIYKKEVIEDILSMYTDECEKALLKGEMVLLSGLGTIIPDVKTHHAYNLPNCKAYTTENAPYVKLRMRLVKKFKNVLDKQLYDNLQNGIYGLENKPFSESQLIDLKNAGFIPDDEEIDYEED